MKIGEGWTASEGQRNTHNHINKANVLIPVDPLKANPFGNAGGTTVEARKRAQG